MDIWEKQLREATHHQYRSRRSENPSFSSSLLDAIYRSIDESNGGERVTDEKLIFYRETMKKKHALRKQDQGGREGGEDLTADMRRRACMIERWMMEKKVSVSDQVRRKSTADFEGNTRNHNSDAILLNSSSSSSESSTCGGNFSSSESDSFYSAKSRSSSSNFYSMQKPKPIRTSVSSSQLEHHQHRNYVLSSSSSQKAKSNSETTGRFVKTKSKALKIYSDLKKVKQPISPGGRLASFLNSLFTNANTKKAKVVSSSEKEITSNCSSASSFSRSCLSKTPSSTGKLSSNNGTKRSVRFYDPVSVIVNEDCRPCGHKNLYENNEELQIHLTSENRRVAEAARELLKSYQKKKENFDDRMRDICHHHDDVHDVDDDDDDAASYASSDLFELDNLSAIGVERYSEELPVYETTHLGTNRAIASGLIL